MPYTQPGEHRESRTNNGGLLVAYYLLPDNSNKPDSDDLALVIFLIPCAQVAPPLGIRRLL